MADTKNRVDVIKECIEYKDPIGVKKLILEDKFKDDSYFWELITLLGGCLTEENLDQFQGFFEVCERCINYILKIGNLSELILALLEQADSFDDTVKFQTFLQIIQSALLRIDARQQFYLELSLETLTDCIKNLELPKDENLEGEERRSHDLDPVIDKNNKYVKAYLDFLKPFIEQVGVGQKSNFKGENFQKQKDCLMKCLMSILDHPLVYLDLTISFNTQNEARTVKSNSRLCAELLISLLLTMYSDPEEIIKEALEHNKRITRLEKHRQLLKGSSNNADGEEDCMLERVPMLALSCVVYLIHHERMAAAVYPCLYTPQGIMESKLQFVKAMLQLKDTEVIRKGVLLLHTLMELQAGGSDLTPDDLDKPEYFNILDQLFNIMIHSSAKEIRQNCLKQVPVFICMFNSAARYRIYTKLFATVKHPGAYGFCVQLFKNQLEEALRGDHADLNQSNPFLFVGLQRIFNLITSLSEGAATDFVDQSDRVIAILNLCRYIVLRDPPNKNQTGFWNFVDNFEKDFLSQVQTGLDIAKGHYRLELTDMTAVKQSNLDTVEMSVCVAGFKLPKMERGQKIEILNQALNTLDLISSLAARLNELIDQQKRERK